METYTLGEIAARVGGTVRGDAGRRVEGIKPLEQAGPEELTFLAHPRYRRAAVASRAAGVLVSEAERLPGHNLIVVGNPYAALARIIDLFHSPERPGPGISPEAVIEPGARIGAGVHVGPCAVVGRGSIVGDRTIVMPGVVLGEKATVGADAVLHPGVVVYRGSVIGDRVVIHAGSVIGSDGFGYAEEGGSRTKIPQVGNVVIEDDVEIGACATIDRATFGSTIIGRGTKIDNLVQVAHNAVIGEGSVLVAQSGIAGSTRLGRAVILAGQAGVAGHLTIGDGAIVGAKSAALRDLKPNAFVVGNPAEDHRAWKRSQAALRRLPDLLHRVARLERTLEAAAVQGPASPGRAKRAAGRPAPRRARRRSG